MHRSQVIEFPADPPSKDEGGGCSCTKPAPQPILGPPGGMSAYFLTGTDTEVGKTFVACALLHAAREAGLKALGMKAVAAGMDQDGHNEDVERLVAASSFAAPRELVNPYCFAAPVAPHIAAAAEGRAIDEMVVVAAAAQLAAQADFLVVEGVGGFRVPLSDDFDSADLAAALGLPVILVVGLRLGCLSHALLTAEAIRARGLKIAGWVANRIDPAMGSWEENVAALSTRIEAPLLGVFPFRAGATPAEAAAYLQLQEK